VNRLISLSLFLSLCVFAQSVDSVLTGTATDPSGAGVPGARIAITNTRTGVAVRTESNSEGVYVFPSLAPGTWRLRAEKQGFQTLIFDQVSLEVGARASLNLPFTVGDTATSIEVKAEATSALGYETASTGGMLSGQQIQELPVTSRSALSLLYTQAGLVGDNIAGGRIGSLNITLDGLNVQDQRLNQGVSSPIGMSVDKIEEFRVITAPADAELGRGSAQIQLISRSGTNQFHGSLFEFHRNTVLNANDWFNNQRGNDPFTGQQASPRNILIRNQYGGRIGGPIRRNKTFFHFLYDAQKIRQRVSITNTTLTESARQGLVRFFPGVQNANAEARTPTVDLSGNPVRPATATGTLQTANLFGSDPNRARLDPSGTVQKMLALLPLPNNFRTGDGLNTAGYTWQRPSSQNSAQFNIKIDHTFNDQHRASVSYTHENQENTNLFSEQRFPDAPGGNTIYRDRMATVNLWSSLRPNILNEFRAGYLRPWLRFYTGWEVDKYKSLIPGASSYPYVIDFASFAPPVNIDDNPVGRISPLYQYSDNLTWIRGKHSLKGGFELRFSSSNGFNSTDVTPRAVIGTGGSPVVGVDRITGIGQNLTTATNILNDLAGSLSSLRQALNAPGGANPVYLPGEVKQRTWKRPEYGAFIKDDWKVRSNLTLNLGVRWDYYGVTYDAQGRTAGLVGGQAALWGITGTSFADQFQPGRLNGSLARVELIGPNSPNPSRQVHNDDFNNFGPAVGLSWQLPWFRRPTVFRTGYSIAYERNSLRVYDAVSGDAPGLRQVVTQTESRYLSLGSAAFPLQPVDKPLSLVPLTDRTQTVRAFQDNLRTPYIQNWSATLARELARGLTMEVRYVATKGTKLVRGTNIDEQIIFENGLLDAFQVTQAGGNAPILDRIFNDYNIAGVGRVNGTTITGSDAVRAISTTQGYLAAHSVASFADYISSNTLITGDRGGLLRRAGLPENFVYANPQFGSSRLTGNFANSTYHSLQVEFTRRYAKGWTLQGNYTWSRALGEEEGAGEEMIDSYRSARNWSLDKRLMSFHRTHVVRTSGTYELPFGPGRKYLTSKNAVLSRAVGGWRTSWIFNVFSGRPFGITSGRSSLNNFGDNTATSVVPIDPGTGEVTRMGNGVTYFANLLQVPDPSIALMTPSIRSRATMRAIADSTGRILLVNPTPGTLGSLQGSFLEGPGNFRLDLNVVKRIPIAEKTNLEFRADAINLTNTPQFDNPNSDMNSVNFGRITGATGERILVIGMRLNF